MSQQKEGWKDGRADVSKQRPSNKPVFSLHMPLKKMRQNTLDFIRVSLIWLKKWRRKQPKRSIDSGSPTMQDHGPTLPGLTPSSNVLSAKTSAICRLLPSTVQLQLLNALARNQRKHSFSHKNFNQGNWSPTPFSVWRSICWTAAYFFCKQNEDYKHRFHVTITDD